MLLQQPSLRERDTPPSRSGPTSSRFGPGGALPVLTALVFVLATAFVVVLWALEPVDCSRPDLAAFDAACAEAEQTGVRR